MFEYFLLREYNARNKKCTSKAFNRWLNDLTLSELIDLANEFGDWMVINTYKTGKIEKLNMTILENNKKLDAKQHIRKD